MGKITNSLTERLADIGGQLQKLRWEAQDTGQTELARDIAHAIEAIAWAAGVYTADGNVIDRPGDRPGARVADKPVRASMAENATPGRISNAA